MTARTTTSAPARSSDRAPLADTPLPVQGKLAAAWGSLIFLILYIDYFHLYQPGEIDSIRNGVIFEFAISGALMSAFFVIIAVPGLMVLLSAILPPRTNRMTNLVVTSLYAPLIIVNFVGTSPDFVFYYVLTISVELAIMAYILRTAAAWPRA